MTGDEFQAAAIETWALRDSSEWERKMAHAICMLSSEAGEVAGLWQKCVGQGHEYDKNAMRDELGDALYAIAIACG